MNLLSHTRPKSSCPSLSLPAVLDCPARDLSIRLAREQGREPVCLRCYALKGRYGFPQVRTTQSERSHWWHTTDPLERAEALAAAMRREGSPRHFRCYDSGDLELSAVETWLRFAELLPETRIWMPTRTWLLPEFLPGLRALNAHPRIVVRPSASAFDDPPPEIAGLAGGLASHRSEAVKAAFRCPGSCRGCRVCWERPDLSVSLAAR